MFKLQCTLLFMLNSPVLFLMFKMQCTHFMLKLYYTNFYMRNAIYSVYVKTEMYSFFYVETEVNSSFKLNCTVLFFWVKLPCRL